jgi:hypothetical protein
MELVLVYRPTLGLSYRRKRNGTPCTHDESDEKFETARSQLSVFEASHPYLGDSQQLKPGSLKRRDCAASLSSVAIIADHSVQKGR